MLDDVGVKVEFERITLEPITDPDKADNLLNSIIEAGLCDPGSNGACARLGRLPVAINGKHKNNDGRLWHCQLKEWKPGFRYSVQQIVEGLQLDLKESSQQNRMRSKKSNQPSDQYQDDVHIPRADENPVIAALKNLGRYKQPLGDSPLTLIRLVRYRQRVDLRK